MDVHHRGLVYPDLHASGIHGASGYIFPNRVFPSAEVRNKLSRPTLPPYSYMEIRHSIFGSVLTSIPGIYSPFQYRTTPEIEAQTTFAEGPCKALHGLNVLLVQTVLTEQTNTSRALNAGPVHRSRLP